MNFTSNNQAAAKAKEKNDKALEAFISTMGKGLQEKMDITLKKKTGMTAIYIDPVAKVKDRSVAFGYKAEETGFVEITLFNGKNSTTIVGVPTGKINSKENKDILDAATFFTGSFLRYGIVPRTVAGCKIQHKQPKEDD